jgi:hypothetical protein
MTHLHFIGFRGDEYNRAIRVFGPPDFIHMLHDHRMYGDVGPDDVLIFAPGADPDVISKFAWQDHANW